MLYYYLMENRFIIGLLEDKRSVLLQAQAMNWGTYSYKKLPAAAAAS